MPYPLPVESISLHPQGAPHGPHPGTYRDSIGEKWTDELAVMCDTYKMLRMTTTADAVEDKNHHSSWVDREGRSTFDADSELSES